MILWRYTPSINEYISTPANTTGSSHSFNSNPIFEKSPTHGQMVTPELKD